MTRDMRKCILDRNNKQSHVGTMLTACIVVMLGMGRGHGGHDGHCGHGGHAVLSIRHDVVLCCHGVKVIMLPSDHVVKLT